MTGLFASAVAATYVGGMLGFHRWNVRRRRGAAGGFGALRRLDREALAEGGADLLALADAPVAAWERLAAKAPASAAEVYLREYLRLTQGTNLLNLELSVFVAKRNLGEALGRFGNRPALFFARALASSLLGFNPAAIDDLARAVYYSGQSPFYVRAVLDTPFLEEVRPALVSQCRRAAPIPK